MNPETQGWIALLLVATAAGWTLRRAWQRLAPRSSRSGCGGGCGCGPAGPGVKPRRP